MKQCHSGAAGTRFSLPTRIRPLGYKLVCVGQLEWARSTTSRVCNVSGTGLSSAGLVDKSGMAFLPSLFGGRAMGRTRLGPSGFGLQAEVWGRADDPVPSAPPSKSLTARRRSSGMGRSAHAPHGDSRSVTEEWDGEVRADPSGGKRCLRVSRGVGEEMLREKQISPYSDQEITVLLAPPRSESATLGCPAQASGPQV